MQIEISQFQIDIIITTFLKYHIGLCEQPNIDPYETNDNKAHLLSALYYVLEFCTTEKEYQKFLEERKNARNSI